MNIGLHQFGSQWPMEGIDSVESDDDDDEFFDAREEVAEGKNAILLGMSQWNSNDLVEQIETIGKLDENQGEDPAFCSSGILHEKQLPPVSKKAISSDLQQLCSKALLAECLIDINKMERNCLLRILQKTFHSVIGEGSQLHKCRTHILILVLHGGNILDTGAGEPSSKMADINTFTSVFEKVTQAHFPSSLGHIVIRLVPCPAVCSEAFSLMANLNPYSYDETSLSSSEDHIPLAALPLLAISSPQYQNAVAMVISRANQVYNEFLGSPDGAGFNGQVCLVGDCVGGMLGFDAICYSTGLADESQVSSRRGSTSSVQDKPVSAEDSNLEDLKRLSKSNIDISGIMENEESRQPLPRKQSDCSNYDYNVSIHSTMLNEDAEFPPTNTSSTLDVNLGRFEFEVSDFFLFGSPLGLVLAMRRTVLPSLEALSHLIADTLQYHSSLFAEDNSAKSSSTQETLALPNAVQGKMRRGSLDSSNSEGSGSTESLLSSNIANITSKWWGAKRIDYVLYCPDVLTAFPTVALPHLFHASYWESTDVVAFILRQVMRFETINVKESNSLDPVTLSPSNPREKWLRKRTQVKLRNVTSNHRSNDVIVAEDGPQLLVGRFMYGPLDMVALTGEKVDIFIMTEPSSGRWVYFDTEITNSSGRISYNVPKDKRLAVGVYPIKMVVRGDQSSAISYLTVLPRGMECVVFSIDGSFAASVSIMGSDPKVRAGAVDVVSPLLAVGRPFPEDVTVKEGVLNILMSPRSKSLMWFLAVSCRYWHWQDLGYLIIYITGRPDMQKQRVVSWLSQHNFPQGMIFFSDGLVHDPLRQKTIFLRNLVQECHIKICAAYGSMKDISVYNVLGLSPSQIYIVGRPAKKYQTLCQFISEGYAAHLASLEFSLRSRPKKNNSRMILRKGSFGLHSQPDFLRKRNHLRRTMSVQQPDPPSLTPKPERAQSQPESDKDHDRHLPSMVWMRGGVHKFESVP
ncbi:Membrane-associated phosphatidylinositol transfer protein 3, partial [Ophiophagus hannah]